MVYFAINTNAVIIGPKARKQLKQIIILLKYIITRKKFISYYRNINDLLSIS